MNLLARTQNWIHHNWGIVLIIFVVVNIFNYYIPSPAASVQEERTANRIINNQEEVFKRMQDQGRRIELLFKEERIQSRALDCLINFFVTAKRRPTIRDVEICRQKASEITKNEEFFQNSPFLPPTPEYFHANPKSADKPSTTKKPGALRGVVQGITERLF